MTSQNPSFDGATLLEDAELAYEKLVDAELRLIKDTEELFKHQVSNLKSIDDLRNHIPRSEQTNSSTKRLGELVETASALIGDVCCKMRRIDLAKTRLEDCLCKVVDILDLKDCRQGARIAMSIDRYEEAAMHIKRYLAINQAELRKTMCIILGRDDFEKPTEFSHLILDVDAVTGETTPSPSGKLDDNEARVTDPQHINASIAELNDTRERLLKLCQDNISVAIKNDDSKNIERFFKIFPMLNEHQDGLKRYAEYLRSKIVTSHVDQIFKSKQHNQADKLAALYESIARLIDTHQPLIETYYGPGHLMVVVNVIQKECDSISRRILEEFRDESNLQYVARIVKSSTLQISGPSNMNIANRLTLSKLDPRGIDNILNEITMILSRSEVYLKFIVQRLKDDQKVDATDDAQDKLAMSSIYNLMYVECELNHLIQEVGGIYVMLEQYYLNESAKKAIHMDQIDVELTSCFVSSMVDDIFFIIKKCTKRAVSTKSNEVFCAIINHCVALLDSLFCQVIDERLKSQQYFSAAFTSVTKNLDISQAYSAIQTSRYLQSTSEHELAKAQYFAALNNLDKACDYIRKLAAILGEDVRKIKPAISVIEPIRTKSQLDKALACLNELTQLASRFSSLANSSLYQLFNASLKTRCKTELKIILSETPELPSIMRENSNELITLSKNLLARLDRSIQDSLTPENYSKLISITKDSLDTCIKSTSK